VNKYYRPERPWNLVVAELGSDLNDYRSDPDWWQARERFVQDYPDETSFVSHVLAAIELYFIQRAHSTANMRLKEAAGKLHQVSGELALQEAR
jgi:hypothetical protein